MIERVWLFHCGYVSVPVPLVDRDAEMGFRKLPMMGALAEHAERGPILIDAPFGHEGPANAGLLTAGLLKTVGLKFKADWSVAARIEQIGFRPGEVDHALMTHLHVDHTGGMKTLGRTQFHIARDEWDYANRLSPIAAKTKGYAPDDYRSLRARIEEFDTPAPLDEEDLDGVDLFGDGSITAVGLPGHSFGHVGFLLKTTDDREIFHLGDAAFTLEQVTERHGLGPMPKSFAYDVDRAVETLRTLRLFHQNRPEVTLINAHDFGLGERCLEGPVAV
jgi:glyoxylase-like metal-dependent hydrolase (beta-lactamase superfamily II)